MVESIRAEIKVQDSQGEPLDPIKLTSLRILVISGLPMDSTASSSITIASLFENWPKDQLAAVCVQSSPNSSSDKNEFFIGGLRWDGLAHLARLALRPWRHSVQEVPGGVPSSKSMPLGASIVYLLKTSAEFLPIFGTSSLHKYIKEFRPDVIYSPLGTIKFIRLVDCIATRHSLPVVPHFFDDWPTQLYSRGPFSAHLRKILSGTIASLMRHVSIGLCIGDEMSVEYKSRYNIPFEPLMLAIADDKLVELAAPPMNRGQVILTYVGGLHLRRWKSILLLSHAISGQDCSIRVFAPRQDLARYSNHFAHQPNVRLGTLAVGEIPSALRESDILLHVESFDSDTSAYARLSVSTKLPQYMASCRPIIAIGPASLASIKLVKRAGCGIAITDESQDSLCNATRSFVSDGQRRLNCAIAGFKYAREHYSKQSATNRLTRIFAVAARMKKSPDLDVGES